MEKLLELADITLIPAQLNGNSLDKLNFGITDKADGSTSLPVFTAPVDSIVDIVNWKTWWRAGIKPILPRTLKLEDRLEGCQYVFAAFSKSEIEENFLARGKRTSQYQFHICIDGGNGHDASIFELSQKLRQLYAGQVNLMAGNIGNAKVYPDYCKAGIDYVRVGMSTGSLCNPDKYGFYTPLASMLLEIIGLRNTACIGLKHTKIIADGSIFSPSDVLKALALGADYVMCGRAFIKLLEASGKLYRKVKTAGGSDYMEEVSPDIVKTPESLKTLEVKRLYCGNTTLGMQAKRDGKELGDWDGTPKFVDAKSEWVRVTGTLQNWINDVLDVFNYGFLMANAKNWTEFQNNIKIGRIQ